LECLEHLNVYDEFYLPEIEKTINSAKNKSEFIFKSGILGNYFAESMIPKTYINKKKQINNNSFKCSFPFSTNSFSKLI